MSTSVCCPRCGGAVRPPDLMTVQWRCSTCGSVAPLSVAPRVGADVLSGVLARIRRHDSIQAGATGASMIDGPVPLWCPWPLPTAWTVTGVGWAGDDRRSPRATALAVSGPAPFSSGPADIVFVAEEPGVGLGTGLGGLGTDAGPVLDAGPALRDALADTPPHATARADGHPTPLWAVPAGPDRSVHVGEARAMWLYAISWPPAAASLLAEGIRLHDLAESVPAELVYGADSGRLVPAAPPGAAGSGGGVLTNG